MPILVRQVLDYLDDPPFLLRLLTVAEMECASSAARYHAFGSFRRTST